MYVLTWMQCNATLRVAESELQQNYPCLYEYDQLMDDQQFLSDNFQRPYHYLRTQKKITIYKANSQTQYTKPQEKFAAQVDCLDVIIRYIIFTQLLISLLTAYMTVLYVIVNSLDDRWRTHTGFVCAWCSLQWNKYLYRFLYIRFGNVFIKKIIMFL